ncbi:HalOD1 output domain-containing protein [Natronorubrum aibiense]|uniref:Halobacterial output domain-containing protein n=1 Tax=Natronorubrum aibiense TaxID=348826 RepID=A0A5P9P8M8_9EURY|nr:HalOD1 output domain-containing protein [Natronorubrum aibiense]QFU84466.1 hypothetical protein GCU68_18220 [Natronorubrum aibiense]
MNDSHSTGIRDSHYYYEACILIMSARFSIRRTEKGGSATVEVAEAVAAVRNTSPEKLSPLYYTVGSDALDALVESGDGIIVCFEYEGFEVLVKPDEIHLEER